MAHDYNNMLGAIIGYAEMAMHEVEEGDSVHSKLQEILKAANRSAEITRQLLGFARKQMVTPVVLNINSAVENMLNMLKHLIGEDIELIWLPTDQEVSVIIDPAQLDQIIVNLCINGRDAISGIGVIQVSTQINRVLNHPISAKL